MLSRTIARPYTTVQKVHAVASKGFNLQTDNYAQTRPSYPQDLLEKIKSLVPADSVVVDLAAGTGLMTQCLVESGFPRVTAVEPVENMRLKLKEVLPQVTCVEGTSWNMPMEKESVDAVVVAQAFHWFDDLNTLKEINRVLKPGGYGVLAWNLESRERSDWIGTFRDAYEVYDKDVPQFRKMNWKNVFDLPESKSLFHLPYTHLHFTNDFLVPKPDLWRRILSKSYISCLSASEQASLKVRMEAILEPIAADDQNRVLVSHDSHLIYFKKC